MLTSTPRMHHINRCSRVSFTGTFVDISVNGTKVSKVNIAPLATVSESMLWLGVGY